jgi:methylmalonyl-CoA mutase N-terminal domain/subunit
MTTISGPNLAADGTPDIDPHAVTISGIALDHLYGPDSPPDALKHIDRDIASPGEFPYTRGLFPQGYRTRLWTMRQFAGFGSADDTNQRFKYLLQARKTQDQSQHRALHRLRPPHPHGPRLRRPALHGRGRQVRRRDRHHRGHAPPLRRHPHRPGHRLPDHQRPRLRHLGHVPRHGQAARLRLERPGRHPPERHPQRVPLPERVHLPPRGVGQARRRHHRVPGPALPKWNSVSISGYHIREAGSSAPQELAFTLRDGMEYVEACLHRGLDIDQFAPRLSFFFNSHNEFFEEIAKLRAARRIWARMMRDRYGAKNERSWFMKTHVQTAGCSLTEQQPLNNIVRVAYQAMAAVLGGCQSLHTDSMDETLGLPTEQAVTVALRTQQILAHETGVTRTVDPLGGSWFMETLTDKIEEEALRRYIEDIDNMAGRPLGPERVAQLTERRLLRGRRHRRHPQGLLPPPDRRGLLPLLRGVRSGRPHHRRRQRIRRRRRGAPHRHPRPSPTPSKPSRSTASPSSRPSPRRRGP